MSAIRIGRAQPSNATPKGFRPPPKGAADLFGDYDRDRLACGGYVPKRRPFRRPNLDIEAPDWTLEEILDDAIFEEAEAEEADEVLGGSDGVYKKSARRRQAGAASARPAARPAPPPAPGPATGMAMRSMAPPEEQAMESAASAVFYRGAAGPGAPPMDKERSEGGFGRSMDAKPASSTTPALPFHALHLGRPDVHDDRASLRAVQTSERYMRSLSERSLSFDGDVIALISAAVRLAEQVGRSVPAGAVDYSAIVGNFAYAFSGTDTVEVPSDGVYHSVPVSEHEVPCALHYVVVPRVDTNVYRIASVTNAVESPILPGASEIYVGGEYVLTTTLPTVAPHTNFTLGLGVEQRIKCARNTTFKESRSGSAVVATSELWHDIAIDVVNNLSRAVHCEVRERIPQPAPDAEVVVEEAEVSPPWVSYKQHERGHHVSGGRRWQLHIEGKSEVKLTARYVVKIYANNEVVGGNRREA